MDFIWESITDWLKEILISGIVNNLSGLFDSTNEQVGNIIGQVGMTPQSWNSGIFTMIQNLSNTVILPIAGAILAIVMTLELIQLVTDRNNLNDVDTWMFFKWVFKSACAVVIVTHTWDIVMGIFEASQSVVSSAAGVIVGQTNIDISSVVGGLESRLNEMELEAESISYAVCQYFGIETADNSFGYIATWSQGKELKELRASLETINKTSSELITGIEKHYREICKERGIQTETQEQDTSPEVLSPESVPEAVPPLAPPKEQEPDYRLPLPDPTITPDMAEQCGYTIPDMYPLSKDRAMELLEKDVVIFTLYPDKPAEMVFDAEDIVNHDGIFGITCEDWQNIHDTIPTRDVHRRFLETPGDAYAVMQLKGSAPAELRYTGLKYLSQPPSPGNYDILYTGPIACAQNQSATLENLFEIFNINRPGDFTGHSLSVSDIIALKQDGVVSYHYCDNVGFQELPDFRQENYLKAAEISTEDDYGMIDGIINNGQKPTVSDLEQQVKNEQSISLMDLAEAVQREKKPSVLKKLKEQPPQSASERKPRKTKEKEI